MTIEEILAGESKNVEFKENLPEKSIKYMKSVVAFANGTGGKIIFGIADKTREVVGFDKEDVFKKMDAIAEYGSVVALSYVAAQRTFFGYNDMADAKSMLESIARSFGYIYGREKNVRVNTISQSPTPTTAGNGIKDMNNLMDFANKMSPLGNATAEDCANYCVMMFSDFTRKVTMQNLYNDGGFSSMGMSLRAMNQYAKDLAPYEDENGKIIYG